VEQRRQRLKATLEEVMATPAGPERTEKIEVGKEGGREGETEGTIDSDSLL